LPNLNLDALVVVLLVTFVLAFGVLLVDSIGLAIAIVLLLAPFHELPWLHADQLRLGKQLLTFAIIGIWLLRRGAGGHWRLARNPLLYAIIPYAALLVISSLLSGALVDSLQVAGADLALLALFLCVSDVATEAPTRRLLLIAALGSLTLGSLLVLVHAASTSAPSPGVVASFSMLSLPIPLTFAMLTQPGETRRWIWLVPLVVMTAAVLFSEHRGTVLAIGVACAGIALFRWRWRFVPFAAAGLAAAALLFGPLLEGYFRTTAGLTGRPTLWAAALRIFADYPLSGTGPGSFTRVYQAYQPSLLELPLQSRPIGALPHAHNIFLNALAELGVFGPVCVALLLGSGLWIAYRVWREQHPARPEAGLALGLLATIAAVCLQELTESGTIFRMGTQNVFFWVFLGLVVGLWRARRSSTEARMPVRITQSVPAGG
jgi:O-antigen ligase